MRPTADDELRVKRLRVAGVPKDKAERAVARGLSDADLEYNRRLGRPMAFVETVHPEAEVQRRRDIDEVDEMRREVEAADTAKRQAFESVQDQ